MTLPLSRLASYKAAFEQVLEYANKGIADANVAAELMEGATTLKTSHENGKESKTGSEVEELDVFVQLAAKRSAERKEAWTKIMQDQVEEVVGPSKASKVAADKEVIPATHDELTKEAAAQRYLYGDDAVSGVEPKTLDPLVDGNLTTAVALPDPDSYEFMGISLKYAPGCRVRTAYCRFASGRYGPYMRLERYSEETNKVYHSFNVPLVFVPQLRAALDCAAMVNDHVASLCHVTPYKLTQADYSELSQAQTFHVGANKRLARAADYERRLQKPTPKYPVRV